MNCSDYSTAWVCRTCGSMISLGYDTSSSLGRTGGGEYCRVCRAEGEDAKGGEDVRMAVPKTNVVKSGVGKGNDMDIIAVPCELQVWIRIGLGRRADRSLTSPYLFQRRIPLPRRRDGLHGYQGELVVFLLPSAERSSDSSPVLCFLVDQISVAIA